MKKYLAPAMLGLGVFWGAATASASITFEFNTVTSGFPDGGPTWAILTITDLGSGNVGFSFENTTDGSVVPNSFITKLLLNIDPFVTGLTMSWDSGTDAEIIGYSFDQDGENDSGSSFDFSVNFDPSDPDRFKPGETVVWQIYGDGLTEDSFNQLSGGEFSRLALLHVQNVNQEGLSAKVQPGEPIPEPASLAALGLGALALLRRRKK